MGLVTSYKIQANIDLGPVVQSIISLTRSLRGLLVKCFATLLSNTHTFFVEKMKKIWHFSGISV